MASGVNTADQAAHAGAGDVVHGNVMLFHPGNDPDVGQTERAAALEGQAERGPLLGWGSLLGHCRKVEQRSNPAKKTDVDRDNLTSLEGALIVKSSTLLLMR